VPLAPTAEQGRIVTKIEELFSFLDAGAGSLLKVQAQLKRYRRAVLKYAFEEKLTEKLQKANKVPVELDDFVVSKGTSSKVLKEWVMAKMTDVCKVRGRVGWKGYTKGDLRTGGPKVIGATHLSEGLRIDMSDPVFISREKYLESPEIMVKMNDIIIAQRGSLGKVALVDYDLGEATINPCVLLLKDIKINSKFLLYLLASPRYQDFLMKGNTSTTTPMITQEFLKNLTIPVPTSSEQDSIVEEIERLLSVAEEVELSVKMSSKREVRLRQSILKTAFEGRLVSQDKNDEPAKKLLERIRETHGRKESLATNNNKQEDLSRYVK
jgi:type I restriction enzyme S subunit